MNPNVISSPSDLKRKHILAGNYEPSEVLPTFEVMSQWDDIFENTFQTKLKKEFVEEFANKRSGMSNAAFFILDKITIFADVDFSIVINIEDFRKFINMNYKTFKRAFDFLVERNYLVWNFELNKYFLTEKTHTLVGSVEDAKDNKYVPTLHIHNWNQFNQLSANQQRFLYHLVNRTCYKNSVYEYEIHQLLHVRSNGGSNTQFTEMYSLHDLVCAFEKYHELGLFTVELKVEAMSEKWVSSGTYEGVQLQQVIDKFEQYRNDYVINMEFKPIYKDTALDNINNLYMIEHFLRQHAPYKVKDYLTFPMITRVFKTIGPLDNQIEINTIIKKLKKNFINFIVEEDKSQFIHLYNISLAEFIHDNYYRLHLLAQEEFAVFNAFKDFYFIPAVLRVIKDTLPIVIPSVIHGDKDFNNDGRITSPTYKIAMAPKTYEKLLQFYANKANSISLIAFRHELKERIANYSKNVQHAQIVKDALFTAHDGFRLIQEQADKKLRDRYEKAVMKYALNVSFDAFATITSFVHHKVKKHDDLLILKLIDKAEKFAAETKQAQYASKDALDFKNQLFCGAKKYPVKLIMDLMRNGVSEELVDHMEIYLSNYYSELSSTVSFVYRDKEGNLPPQKATTNTVFVESQLLAREYLGLNTGLSEEKLAAYNKLDDEMHQHNFADKYIVMDIILDEEKIHQLQKDLHDKLISIARSDRFAVDKQKLIYGKDIPLLSYDRYYNIDKQFLYNNGFSSRILEDILTSDKPIQHLTDTLD